MFIGLWRKHDHLDLYDYVALSLEGYTEGHPWEGRYLSLGPWARDVIACHYRAAVRKAVTDAVKRLLELG